MKASTAGDAHFSDFTVNPTSLRTRGDTDITATPAGAVGNASRGIMEMPRPTRTMFSIVPKSCTWKRIANSSPASPYAARNRRSLLYLDITNGFLASSRTDTPLRLL
jgi:hypothetical protein